MGKKKATKKAKEKREKEKDSPIQENTQPENPFDFGGIPDRNLKKNLGCG